MKPEDQEPITKAGILWSAGIAYLNAARKLGTDHDPACFLACHGIELALRSHLRAKGADVRELTYDIRHDIDLALARALATGVRKPPIRVRSILTAASKFHKHHEFRYPVAEVRFGSPTLLRLLLAGAWALDAAAPAVVGVEVRRKAGLREIHLSVMRRDVSKLRTWVTANTPPSSRENLRRLYELLSKQAKAAD